MEQLDHSMVSAAERLLVLEAGGALHSAEDGILAAARIHSKLVAALSPIIGDAGFDALFARSLKLTRSRYAALRDVRTDSPVNLTFEQFCAALKHQPPPIITEILSGSIATFIGLLSTFIGAGLTLRLLSNVWPAAQLLESAPSENA
jgi:hypothetical protein